MVGAALGIGLVWGVLARGWMRLISTDPAYTFEGSLFITLAFGFVVGCQAIALLTRRRRSRAARTAGRLVGLVGLLPLFFGGGAIMLPTVVGGGLGAGQTAWPRAARMAIGLLALVPVVSVSATIVKDFGLGPRALVAIVALVAIYAGVVFAATASLGRAPDAPPLPRGLRVALTVVGVGVLLFFTVGIAGLRR
jgi:hypothetical protein